jgi:hypothetical protein
MEDAEDRPKEDETPLMRFLKANRELLQTSVGSEQEQPQQLGETTTAPSKSNASQQQLEEGENGDKTSLMTSNLHLLAEIATRESPSPEQPTDEHMASTSTLSDRQTTTARPLPPPGLHLLPLSVLTGRGSRPVGPIREEAASGGGGTAGGGQRRRSGARSRHSAGSTGSPRTCAACQGWRPALSPGTSRSVVYCPGCRSRHCNPIPDGNNRAASSGRADGHTVQPWRPAAHHVCV